MSTSFTDDTGSTVIVFGNEAGSTVVTVNTGPQGPPGAAVGVVGTGFLFYNSGIPVAAIPVDPTTAGHMTVGAANTVFVSNGTTGSWVSVDLLGGVADDIAKSAGTLINRVRGIRGVPISGSDGAPSTIGAVPVYNAVGTSSYKMKKPTPGGWYDVTDYGAVGDGLTNDQPAIMDAIAAMGSSAGVGGVLYFPPGNYYCADDVHIYKQIDVHGLSGGVGNTLAKLTFAAGKGLVIWQEGSPYGGIGSGSSVRHLSIVTSHVAQPEWAATTAYSVGDRMHLGVRSCNWVYFECIKAGISGGTAPLLSVLPRDGDYSDYFVPSGTYYRRQIVRGTSGGSLITTVYFEVTSVTGAGVAGASEPTWNTTIGATTVSGDVTFTARDSASMWITDGTVVWAAKLHNGLRLNARAYVEDVYIFGATNAGFCVRATSGAPFSNANHWEAKDVRIVQCGIGAMVSGGDSNVGTGTNIDVESAGYNPGVGWMPGNGGYGIWDASFLGCTWIGCHVANGVDLATFNGGGPSYRGGDGASYSVFLGCYSESYAGRPEIRNILKTPAIMIGGNQGAGFVDSETAVWIFDGNGQYGCRNLVGKQDAAIVGGTVLGYLGSQGDYASAFRWSHSTDASTMGLSYTSSISGWAAKWWAFGHGAQSNQMAFAIPGESAAWPSGKLVGTYSAPWLVGDHAYIGPRTANPPSIGFANSQPTSGHFERGSVVWKLNPSATDPIGWRCLTSTVYSGESVVTEATWEEVPWPSGGDVTGASNEGGGDAEVFIAKTAGVLELRTISGVGGITVSENGDVIEVDGSGITPSSPGGSDTQVQFNDGGSFGGDSGFTYNKTTDSATLAGSIALNSSAASTGAVKLAGTGNQAQVVWRPGSDDHNIVATSDSGTGQITFGAATIGKGVLQGDDEASLGAGGDFILRAMTDFIRMSRNLAGDETASTSLALRENQVTVASSGDTTLTADEAASPLISLTGSPAHGPLVIFPANLGAFWFVYNGCSGGVYCSRGGVDILLAAGDFGLFINSSNSGWRRWF